MSQTISYRHQMVLPFRDKSSWLIVIGIVMLLASIMTGCAAAVTPLVLVLPQPPGQPPIPMVMSQLLMIAAMYAGLSIVLGSIGVGCLLKRRWARPLTLILSTHWLIIGFVSIISMIVTYPITVATLETEKAIPQSFVLISLGIGLAIGIGVMVVLPSFIIWVMKSGDVRLTLEHYDPQPRWTDRCPLNILGLSVTLWMAGALIALGAIYAVLPIFGMLLTGWLAATISLSISILLVLAGYWVYQLQVRGWWVGLLALVLPPLAMIPSILVIPVTEMYRKFGTPQAQLDVVAQHATLIRISGVSFMLLFVISFSIYMLRLLPRLRQASVHNDPSPV